MPVNITVIYVKYFHAVRSSFTTWDHRLNLLFKMSILLPFHNWYLQVFSPSMFVHSTRELHLRGILLSIHWRTACRSTTHQSSWMTSKTIQYRWSPALHPPLGKTVPLPERKLRYHTRIEHFKGPDKVPYACKNSLNMQFIAVSVCKDSYVIIACGFDWVGILWGFTESLANHIMNNYVMSYSQKWRHIEIADSIILWITN